MNIPRFWAKAEQHVTIGQQRYHFVAWKGSDEGLEAARRFAATALAERIARKERGESLGQYPKNGLPLREEIIEELQDVKQQRIAVITRNAAGCLVLNTSNVMFVDVDIENAPYLQGTGVGCLMSLFTVWFRKPRDEISNEDKVLAHIRTWHTTHPDWTLRIYKTKRGFRLLVTHALFNPTDASVDEVMKELGADGRYRMLCKAQACFRARLTPKPWRIHSRKPTTRYPWETPERELEQRTWEERYHRVIRDYSVCQIVETLGTTSIHPVVEQIIRVHDSYVLKDDKPLA
ncbi:MAG: hypothetical protein ACRCYY_07215 [Trueperaceae bacterium]